jgi:hypothetical protein
MHTMREDFIERSTPSVQQRWFRTIFLYAYLFGVSYVISYAKQAKKTDTML